MTDWSTINGERTVAGSLYVPAYGTWVADVALALIADITGRVTLTVGNLSLVGSIVRAGTYAGSRTYRLVGGAGGWRQDMPARSYVRSAGVPASMVLGDIATECGETIADAPTTILGTSFVRLAGMASRTLASLAPRWYVDTQGVTRVGSRPSSPIRSEFVPTNRNGGAGVVEVATEDPAAWMPGRTFTSPLLSSSLLTVSASRFSWRLNGRARVDVVTS